MSHAKDVRVAVQVSSTNSMCPVSGVPDECPVSGGTGQVSGSNLGHWTHTLVLGGTRQVTLDECHVSGVPDTPLSSEVPDTHPHLGTGHTSSSREGPDTPSSSKALDTL